MQKQPNPFRIVMRQTITDPDERQRRLAIAFDTILNFDLNNVASPSTEFGDLAEDEAEDTPAETQELQEYSPNERQ